MTKQEFLRERYEDAIFAILMDNVVTKAGEKIIKENDLLLLNPNAELSLDLQCRCINTIRGYFFGQRRKSMRYTTRKILSRIAIAVIIIIMTMATVFASSEDFRDKTLNWIIETFDKGTSIQVTSAENSDTPDFIATQLPDGFIFNQESSDVYGTYVKYVGTEDGSYISIESFSMGTGSFLVDTEDANVINSTIQGYNAMIIEKDDVSQIIILKDKTTIIQLKGELVKLDILIEVANHLEIL